MQAHNASARYDREAVPCVDRLAGLLEISGVEAGLQTVGWLRTGIDGEAAAARAAARRHVEVTPRSRYGRGTAVREGLQLGFAAVDLPEIRRGVGDLAAALAEEAVARAGRPPVSASAAPGIRSP
jgi:GntR family transcriptional regulator/MocR family aminotransferase